MNEQTTLKSAFIGLKKAEKERDSIKRKISKLEKCGGDCKHCKHCTLETGSDDHSIFYSWICENSGYSFDYFDGARENMLDCLKDDLHFAEMYVESYQKHIATIQHIENAKPELITF